MDSLWMRMETGGGTLMWIRNEVDTQMVMLGLVQLRGRCPEGLARLCQPWGCPISRARAMPKAARKRRGIPRGHVLDCGILICCCGKSWILVQVPLGGPSAL